MIRNQQKRGNAFRAVFQFSWFHWRRQPIRLALITGSVLLAMLAEVFVPLFSGRLVDAIAFGVASDQAAWDATVSAFLALLALGVVSLTLRTLLFYVLTDFTLRSMSEIAQDAFARLQRFSTDWHANNFAGSTVRKVTRGMWALDVFNDTLLIALLPTLVMLLGSTILLGFYWPTMGLFVAIGSAIFIAVTVMISLGYVAPAAVLSNRWDTRVGGALADAVSCNPVVKAFGAERREDSRLAGLMVKWRGRTRRTWLRGTLHGVVQGITILVLRAVVIGYALVLWSRGEMSAGDIAFVLTSFAILSTYLRDVGMYVRDTQRSVNEMEELVEIHAEAMGVRDRDDARPIAISEGEIAFERVSFLYGGHATPLYQDFSVVIPAGQRVGLVGHSGSGKTTFVKLIQRLYDVTGGRILIDGQDIATVQQSSLRAQIAIVQQEPVLFHRSLAENIAYARPGATMAQTENAARQASAHDFISALPKGYATLVGERGVKLSGGERQRVAIARAFLADAPILILDEATSSLDSVSEILIQQAMERLMIGRTTLVIAHRLSTVRSLDRLLVFDRGRIAEEGTHADLVRLDGGIYRRLFERQALELTRGLVE